MDALTLKLELEPLNRNFQDQICYIMELGTETTYTTIEYKDEEILFTNKFLSRPFAQVFLHNNRCDIHLREEDLLPRLIDQWVQLHSHSTQKAMVYTRYFYDIDPKC